MLKKHSPNTTGNSNESEGSSEGLHGSKTFQLHERLQQDTLFVTDLALSRVLLMNDARFPWLILVPRKNGISELHELEHTDQILLLKEITRLSTILKNLFEPDKLNIATIGNIVSQLHIHIVARKKQDVAWPSPVWGFAQPQLYPNDQIEKILTTLKRMINNEKQK